MPVDTKNEEPVLYVKKKPGRPRKKPLKPPSKKNGVGTSPTSDGNMMEMVYDNPLVLKKIFSFFKSMAVNEISITFDSRQIVFDTTDHLRKSYIRIVIDCEKITHYYCEEKTQIHLNPKSIEKIIQVLDKHYLSVVFILKKITSRSSLTIIYKNELNIDEYREVSLIQAPDVTHYESFDDSDYPIKFTLPGKYFKKIVSDVSLFTNTFTINKIGHSPLAFMYASDDKTIKSKHIVQSPESIDLVSTVAEDGIFSSSVQIDYIKPLSSSILSEKISISAHTHSNIIFKADIDADVVRALVSTDTVKLK